VLTRSALVALFLCCSATPILAAESVGEATSLRPSATQATSGSAPQALAWKDQIYKNAQLATTDKGALEVTFLDHSKLSIGPNSSMTVDEFVYSSASDSSQALLKYGKGAFRFISGAMSEKHLTLQTPTATIGIRGTIIRTLILADGTTTVGLDEGTAVITSVQTGQSITLTAGQKITIKPGGTLGVITLGKVEGCD
jgi:hypothetical protein